MLEIMSLLYKKTYNVSIEQINVLSILLFCSGNLTGDPGPKGSKGEKGSKGDGPYTAPDPIGNTFNFICKVGLAYFGTMFDAIVD